MKQIYMVLNGFKRHLKKSEKRQGSKIVPLSLWQEKTLKNRYFQGFLRGDNRNRTGDRGVADHSPLR